MENNDTIDLSKYIATIKRHWYWYIISLVAFTALAVTYHFMRMDQYSAHAALLIEDDEGESGSGMRGMGNGMQSLMRTFSIGGMGSSSIDNEIEIFETRNTLIQAIKRLQLNRMYIERDGIKKRNLYKTSPISVEMAEEILDTLSTGLVVKVHLYASGKVDIKVQKGFFSRTIAEEKNITLPASLNTVYGTLQVLKSENYSIGIERDIKVYVSGNEIAAENLSKLIDIDLLSKKSDGVELSMKTPTKKMGEDMLNTLMGIYNETRQFRKNDRAQQTLDFYDNQIAELSSQLRDSEERVEKYKNDNNLVDLETEAKIAIGADNEFENRLASMRNEVMLQDIILNFLNQEQNHYKLLPMTEGAGSASGALAQYNDLIMRRMQLEQSATKDNPVYDILTTQIDALRATVIETVKRARGNTLATISNVQKERGKYQSKLGQLPQYEREYFDLMRDKELKNELYVFLMSKRYESAMTLSLNYPRGFIIEPAYCELKPSLKKSFIALGVCFAFALIIPTVVLSVMAYRKN